MKIVIGEYGKAVLAAISALLILGLCLVNLHSANGKGGIFEVLTEQAGNGAAKDASRESNEMYQMIQERKEPTIRYRNCFIYAGEPLDWASMFEAIDADGEAVEWCVTKINGKPENIASYCFPESGVYEVEVSAVDSYGIISNRLFNIPVQRASFGREKKG